MRVLTWNMLSRSWKDLLDLDPDVAVLQEVFGAVPESVRDRYDVEHQKASWLGGGKAKFSTAVFARKSDWTMGPEVTWKSEHDWVNQIQKQFPGWLVGRQVENKNRSGERLNVVSVHSPFFAVKCSPETPDLCKILDGVDVTPVRLKNRTACFFTEILWSLLKGAAITADDNWIVAGDFNSSVLFDKPDDRANEEVIDRLNALGLFDCVFRYHKEHVPTWWGFPHRSSPPKHQLDYVYVTRPMLGRLTGVDMGGGLPETKKWDGDHLPIVCDFR